MKAMNLDSLKTAADRDGFGVFRQLLSAGEVAEIKDRFEQIWEQGVPGYFSRDDHGPANSCERYPRIIHPHRFDEMSLRYLLDPRIGNAVGVLLDDEPIAAQTMYYWKPPGTPGQAPHQDNLYLQANDRMGCVAAWIAIDDCDEENGCLICVPGSHRLELQCPGEADPSISFTGHHVGTPEGFNEVPIRMKAGDCLFFFGTTIHGSTPNVSENRSRRSFICHYIGSRSTESASFYNPLIRMNGEQFENSPSTMGSPCGVAFEGPH
jgi:ectoine hydroxylase-related dioxygenase (phytanoyl-CoA dioxygenase family)